MMLKKINRFFTCKNNRKNEAHLDTSKFTNIISFFKLMFELGWIKMYTNSFKLKLI